jgi:hypothetical protein
MTTTTHPAAVTLLALEAESQELLPDHTYKAVMGRVNCKGNEEFKRGLRTGVAA